MPTKNKRVNLAIPDAVYERLLKYKEKNGITSDAGACLMLIVRQLDAIEESEKMMDMMSRFSMDELQKLSTLGLAMIQQETQKNDNN